MINNKKRMVVINGRFLEQKLTGVQRYALEITKAIDTLQPDFPVILAIPKSLPDSALPQLKHIRVVKIGTLKGILWEQWNLAWYIIFHHATGLHLCNTVPFLAPNGICCIHDITYKANPQYITTRKLKIISVWHNIQTFTALHFSRAIITVSNFSKNQIIEFYHIKPEKITVVYNGWQHFDTSVPEVAISERYPFLKKNEYYFSLATVAKNKNFAWIIKTARLNPKNVFAVAGNSDLKKLGESVDGADNIYYLGYVSDENAKLLMKQCKAFLFPSFYEGFGIPPLEALAMNARVICSHSSCLPEIFGDAVCYIDPQVPCSNLDDLLEQKVSSPGTVLSKYNWNLSAKKIIDIYNSLYSI